MVGIRVDFYRSYFDAFAFTLLAGLLAAIRAIVKARCSLYLYQCDIYGIFFK
jgi:hypothetical protein